MSPGNNGLFFLPSESDVKYIPMNKLIEQLINGLVGGLMGRLISDNQLG